MQEKVYKHHVKDISELQECTIVAWEELDQRIINTAIEQWRTRLRACIKALGKHFKHNCDLLYHISCIVHYSKIS